MHALFDHLIAIIVGAVLVGTLLFVQMRRQESAVETTVRNRVEWHTDEFLSTLQRDVENMRTIRQTNHAFGFDRYRLQRSTDSTGMAYTSQFTFPTLADPDLGVTSPVAIVSYEMKPTGQRVRVGTVDRRTYTITRYEYRRGRAVRATGGAVGILELNVIALLGTGAEQANGVTGRSDIASQVKISTVAAAPVGARRTGDQATRTTQNAVRRATTVRVLSATATEGLPPVESPTVPAIPPVFPADPAPTTPTSTPTGSGSSGGGGTTTSTTGSGGTRTPTAPPPPTPPAPPPGIEI